MPNRLSVLAFVTSTTVPCPMLIFCRELSSHRLLGYSPRSDPSQSGQGQQPAASETTLLHVIRPLKLQACSLPSWHVTMSEKYLALSLAHSLFSVEKDSSELYGVTNNTSSRAPTDTNNHFPPVAGTYSHIHTSWYRLYAIAARPVQCKSFPKNCPCSV